MALLHVVLCALSAGLAPAVARGGFLANLQGALGFLNTDNATMLLSSPQGTPQIPWTPQQYSPQGTPQIPWTPQQYAQLRAASTGVSFAPQPSAPVAAVAPVAKVPTYALLGIQGSVATQQNISLQQLDAAFLEQNAALENANAALEQHNAGLEVANAELEKKYAALEKRDAVLATAYSSLRQGEDFLEKNFVMLQQQNAELAKNKTGIERAMDFASKRVALLEGANRALQDKAASLSTVLQSVQEVVTVLKGEVAATGKPMPDLTNVGILQQAITPTSHAPDGRTTQHQDSAIAAGGQQQQQQQQSPWQQQQRQPQMPAFGLQPSPLQAAMAQPMQFGPQGPLAMMSWSAPGTNRQVDMSAWATTSN